MRWQGAVVGVLALALLEVVVSSQASASRAGNIVVASSKLINKIVDPKIPAFGSPTGVTGGSGAQAVSGGQAAINQMAPAKTTNFDTPLPAGVIAV